MNAYILVAPNGLMHLSSLSASRGAAKYAVVGTAGDDGRLHTWGWWRSQGWRCKGVRLEIISGSPDTDSEDTQ